MNKLVTLVSAVLLTASAAWADPYYVKQTSDGFLNVRSGPGTQHGILRVLYPGNQVRVLGQSGNWLRVRILSGTVGWVHKDYVRN